jgi:hypothetical protein
VRDSGIEIKPVDSFEGGSRLTVPGKLNHKAFSFGTKTISNVSENIQKFRENQIFNNYTKKMQKGSHMELQNVFSRKLKENLGLNNQKFLETKIVRSKSNDKAFYQKNPNTDLPDSEDQPAEKSVIIIRKTHFIKTHKRNLTEDLAKGRLQHNKISRSQDKNVKRVIIDTASTDYNPFEDYGDSCQDGQRVKISERLKAASCNNRLESVKKATQNQLTFTPN